MRTCANGHEKSLQKRLNSSYAEHGKTRNADTAQGATLPETCGPSFPSSKSQYPYACRCHGKDYQMAIFSVRCKAKTFTERSRLKII